MRRWIVVALSVGAVGLSLALTACGAGGGSSSGGEKQFRIGVVSPPPSSAYFTEMHEGLEIAAERDPAVDLEYLFTHETNASASEEVPAINNALTKEVDALIVVDGFDTTKPSLSKALAEGTPVIFLDYDGSGLPPSETTLIATDNAAAGKLAGNYIASVLHDEGQVGLLDGLPTIPVNYERTDEARKVLEAKGVEVVARQTTNCEVSKGVPATQNILTAHPDVNLLYSGCGDPIPGVIAAVDRAGKAGQVKIVDYDATPEDLKFIREGKELASVAQFPKEMGYLGVGAAVKAIKTGKVPKDVVTGTVVVTKANADTALDHQIPAE